MLLLGRRCAAVARWTGSIACCWPSRSDLSGCCSTCCPPRSPTGSTDRRRNRRRLPRGHRAVRRHRRLHPAQPAGQPGAGGGGPGRPALAVRRDRPAAGLEKIKTIGDAYMVAGAYPTCGPTTPRRSPGWRWRCARRSLGAPARTACRWRSASASTPASGGRRHRQAAVQLRPVGRHRQRPQPHGVPGGRRLHPGDRPHLRTPQGRLALRAAETDPRQGQGGRWSPTSSWKGIHDQAGLCGPGIRWFPVGWSSAAR
jgi:hypothetical protein